MPGLTQMTFGTIEEMRLQEGYTQLQIELEKKRAVSDPTFEAVDSDEFLPISIMLKSMPEFTKETHSTKQMLNVS